MRNYSQQGRHLLIDVVITRKNAYKSWLSPLKKHDITPYGKYLSL